MKSLTGYRRKNDYSCPKRTVTLSIIIISGYADGSSECLWCDGKSSEIVGRIQAEKRLLVSKAYCNTEYKKVSATDCIAPTFG